MKINTRMMRPSYACAMSYKNPEPSVETESVALDFGPPSTEANASLLDDPQEWSAFGRPVGPSATHDPQPDASRPWDSHVVLQGMHCAACALTIEDALRRVPGVERAEVSAATQRARVVWNPAQVLPSQWMAAVERAGYQVFPARDAFAREIRKRESRRALWRWLVAGLCMMQVMMYAWPAYSSKPGDLTQEMETLLRWASWVLSLPVVLFACGPFFSNALRDVRARRVSMDLPVAMGMLITFVVSTLGTFDPSGPFGAEVFFDSLTMFVFFLLSGRLLEMRLRDRTAGALEAVMNRLPDSVERLAANGQWERVATRRLQTGDTVRVLAGEAFPADGEITAGSTHADEALLTGESTPVPRHAGDRVAAGSYNLDAAVQVRLTAVGEGTQFAQIVSLMESASLQKPRLAQLADRVARPFLMAVLAAAALAAAWWWPASPSQALMVAAAVLIVTCPCALSLATPVAMLTAAGTLARGGVLVRNLQGLEALAAVDTLVFDKTGTLTRDGMAVRSVQPGAGVDAAEALALAALLARQSVHPASRAVAHAAEADAAAQALSDRWQIVQVQERAGFGMLATVSDREQPTNLRYLRLGSLRHAGAQEQADTALQQVVLTEDHAASAPRDGAPRDGAPRDGAPRGLMRIGLSEGLRPAALDQLAQVRAAGIDVRLLSGDRDAAVQRIAARTGIARAVGDCTPQDKLARLQAAQARGRQVAMVGDGLNDGPVLAGAHVSFAFGRAVPLAQSRSDFVVLGDHLELVVQTLLLARRTLRIVRQNLCWAAAYNAVSVPLALAGWMPAWLAGLGMALSSLLVVLNAARLARAMPLDPAAAHAPVAAAPALSGAI